MSKELEALEDIILYLNASEPKGLYCENIENIQQALLELQSIKEANTSEALKKLEMLSDCAEAMKEAPSSNWIEYANNETELDYKLWRAYEDLKQALLKAEKDEKIILGIEDYLNRRIKGEPLEDVRKAFIEIRTQLQVIKEVLE